MMRKLNLRIATLLSATFLTSTGLVSSTLMAAPPERPTFNHTADPRPNILPNWMFTHHVPYRLTYNRPTYHVGKALYYVGSPTSQEAMAWKENLDAGRYNGHNCPPLVKRYFYPKPWEVMNTGPRPDYANVSGVSSPAANTPVVPAPAEAVDLPAVTN
ncbi:MAG: hypothetical protein IT423_06455 [Pirellulaceae bacterium]|nr:hypothetical protein [Pirellulaceae bacterium]